MLLRRVVAPFLDANCYVLAQGAGAEALVVDPGAGAAPGVRAVLDAHDLRVGAVLLTHGHPDHVWDAAAVAGDAPVYVAAPDLPRLEDPGAFRRPHDPDFVAMIATPWQRPAEVRELPGSVLTGGGAPLVPGVPVRVIPAPGHTEGSTVTLLGEHVLDLREQEDEARDIALVAQAVAAGTRSEPRGDHNGGRGEEHGGGHGGEHSTADEAPEAAAPVALALSGDVIFQGSIGRTDLAGGDPEVMAWTLRTLSQVLHPATVLLPGHGPATWWARELTMNPYVRQALVDQ